MSAFQVCDLCIGIEHKPAVARVTITDLEGVVSETVAVCQDCLNATRETLR